MTFFPDAGADVFRVTLQLRVVYVGSALVHTCEVTLSADCVNKRSHWQKASFFGSLSRFYAVCEQFTLVAEETPFLRSHRFFCRFLRFSRRRVDYPQRHVTDLVTHHTRLVNDNLACLHLLFC